MPSRRAAAIAFAVALGVGLCALLIGGATTQSQNVATLGVLGVYPVAPIAAGQEACQSDIGLSEPVETVRFPIGTFAKPGPELEATVHPEHSGLVLGRGRIAAGWVDDGSPKDFHVGRIAANQTVTVCVRNVRGAKAYVYGDIDSGYFGTGFLGFRVTPSHSEARIQGALIPGDMSVEFVSKHSRSLLTRIPSAFRHAAEFRPGFVGPWTFWLLAGLILLLAPLGLWRALARALREEREA
jgi:hypothetical protein